MTIDELVARKAYELECLIALRNIHQTHSCNECHNKECGFKPKPGNMVRYNCPLFKGEENERQDN